MSRTRAASFDLENPSNRSLAYAWMIKISEITRHDIRAAWNIAENVEFDYITGVRTIGGWARWIMYRFRSLGFSGSLICSKAEEVLQPISCDLCISTLRIYSLISKDGAWLYRFSWDLVLSNEVFEFSQYRSINWMAAIVTSLHAVWLLAKSAACCMVSHRPRDSTVHGIPFVY